MRRYDKMSTKVMFRMDKDREGSIPEVTAVFPREFYNKAGTYCYCYSHIGQHSSCMLEWVDEFTRPATQEEYKDLYNELVSIGYDDLQIVRTCKE
jgi:hypothetical protein